jgi:hypothetical protein
VHVGLALHVACRSAYSDVNLFRLKGNLFRLKGNATLLCNGQEA